MESELLSEQEVANEEVWQSESNGKEFGSDQDSCLDCLSEVQIGESLSGNISVHNFQFPYSAKLAIGIYLTFIGLLSTLGNTLFVISVSRWRYLRNNSHMLLLLNMSLCDLAISITGYPYTTISAYVGNWIFGDVICQLYAFLCFTFSQVSMNTLLGVSVFRYVAICKPHWKHFLNTHWSKRALAAIWIHALFWTSAPLLGWSGYDFEPTGLSCSFDWNDRSFGGVTYVVGTVLFCYVTHVVVMGWCYWKIIVEMIQRNKRKRRRSISAPIDPEPGLSTRRNSEDTLSCEGILLFTFTHNLSSMEVHILQMNILMVLTFLVLWTPYAVLSVVSSFRKDLSPYWYIFPTIFAKTSCAVNPVLYGLTNSFLRKELVFAIKQCFGLTTPLEEFQFMRQKEQDRLYDKEGVFLGKRSVGFSCTCDSCVASRHQIQLSIRRKHDAQFSGESANAVEVLGTDLSEQKSQGTETAKEIGGSVQE